MRSVIEILVTTTTTTTVQGQAPTSTTTLQTRYFLFQNAGTCDQDRATFNTLSPDQQIAQSLTANPLDNPQIRDCSGGTGNGGNASEDDPALNTDQANDGNITIYTPNS